MRHENPRRLSRIATVSPTAPVVPLSRDERLRRWAAVLEARGAEPVTTLLAIEYRGEKHRRRLRCDGSALSVAFEDPVLRRDGLNDDTYDTARRYFELSAERLHRIICYCHFGRQARSSDVALAIRAELERPRGLLKRLAGIVSRR